MTIARSFSRRALNKAVLGLVTGAGRAREFACGRAARADRGGEGLSGPVTGCPGGPYRRRQTAVGPIFRLAGVPESRLLRCG